MTTPLRQRMIEDMQLHGLSANTQDAYVRAIKQLAEYYNRSPEQITQERVLQNSMPECYPEEFVDSLAFVE